MFVRNTFTATVTNDTTIHDLLGYSEATHSITFQNRVELTKDVRAVLLSIGWNIHFQDEKDCILWDGQKTFLHYYDQKFVIKEESIDNTKMGGWKETIHEGVFGTMGEAASSILGMVGQRREENNVLVCVENNLDKKDDHTLTLSDGTIFYIVKG